jgi:hypothetical protein
MPRRGPGQFLLIQLDGLATGCRQGFQVGGAHFDVDEVGAVDGQADPRARGRVGIEGTLKISGMASRRTRLSRSTRALMAGWPAWRSQRRHQ